MFERILENLDLSIGVIRKSWRVSRIFNQAWKRLKFKLSVDLEFCLLLEQNLCNIRKKFLDQRYELLCTVALILLELLISILWHYSDTAELPLRIILLFSNP